MKIVEVEYTHLDKKGFGYLIHSNEDLELIKKELSKSEWKIVKKISYFK